MIFLPFLEVLDELGPENFVAEVDPLASLYSGIDVSIDQHPKGVHHDSMPLICKQISEGLKLLLADELVIYDISTITCDIEQVENGIFSDSPLNIVADKIVQQIHIFSMLREFIMLV